MPVDEDQVRGTCACRLQSILVTEVMPDTFVNAVLFTLEDRPDVTDVILGRDGRWRVSECEPWHDIRQAHPAALRLPAPPTSDAPSQVAPTSVVDAAAPAKPSPQAVPRAGGAAVGGSGAIEILSSDEDEPIATRGGGAVAGDRDTAEAAGAGSSAAPPLKRPRLQQGQTSMMATAFGGLPLTPQLAVPPPPPPPQQALQPHLFVSPTVPVLPSRQAAVAPTHVHGGHGPQANAHRGQNMPNQARGNGFAFR